jgi:hypothetical protein
MSTTDDLVSAARSIAEDLQRDMQWYQSGGYEYWQATNPHTEPRIHARAITALDFFDRFAGRDSQWAIQAHEVFEKNTQSMASGARALGDVLLAWIDQVNAGLVVPRLVEAQGARTIASTDLMEQVRVLNEDRTVHPAAPIVLAGAALEVALRSAIEELDLELTERPSISAYARRLRSDRLLSPQDIKDVEQMAGLRNAAAHGEFEALSRERAGLLEQQVNLFLDRLDSLLEAHR